MHSLRNDYIALHQYQARLLKRHGGYGNIHDSALLDKLNRIQGNLEHLKHMLSMEKQQLERERWQTQSMYSFPRKEHLPNPHCYCPHESYSYQTPYLYANPPTPIDWTNYVVTPNYEYEAYINDLPAKNLYESFYSRNMGEIRGDVRALGLYKGHLEDVEKMCTEELMNMENSLMNLRKIRRDWNCNEINATMEPIKKKGRHSRRTKYYCYRDH